MATLSLFLAGGIEPCMGCTTPRVARGTLISIEGTVEPLLREVDKYSRCLSAVKLLLRSRARPRYGHDVRAAGTVFVHRT
jgi:hypothetical protein